MRHPLIAVAVAAAAVVALSSTSATQRLPFGGGHTIVIAAPFDDPKVEALAEQRLIEQSLSNATPIVNLFASRGGKASACDRMTNSTVRWCLTTP